MLCRAACSNDALDRYADATLTSCYDALQGALDDYTSSSSGDRNNDAGGGSAARAAYVHLCAQQPRVRPSSLVCAFLDAHAATDDADATTTTTTTTRAGATGELCFDRTYLGSTALLPVLVTVSAYCRDTLRVLSLREQQLTSVHVQLLCRALAPMTRLTSLDVSYNPCGCGGVRALLWLVQHTPTLVRCEARGVQAIASLTRRLRDAVARNASRSRHDTRDDDGVAVAVVCTATS